MPVIAREECQIYQGAHGSKFNCVITPNTDQITILLTTKRVADARPFRFYLAEDDGSIYLYINHVWTTWRRFLALPNE
jgi:hypothetical protein